MIIKGLWAFVCLAMFVPGTSFAQGDTAKSKGGEAQIVKMTEDLVAAEVRGDVSAIERFLTDNYTHTHAVGLVQSRAEFLSEFKPGTPKYTGAEISQVQVRLFGTSAIISGHELINGLRPYLFTAFWVQEQGKWRLAAWVASPVPKSPSALKSN